MKKNIIKLFIVLITLSSCSKDDMSSEVKGDIEVVKLSLLDKNATNLTKALYSNLWKIQSVGTMYGHHDDLIYGRNWYTEFGRSDTKDVVGDYPAVFSLDVAEIMDDRSGTSDLNDDRIRTIKEARSRGEVITACAHLNNPFTGGDSWDNNSNTVSEILNEGSVTNQKFIGWLDKLADFSKIITDNNGELIPIIFRPFHEHTQGWSWWGSTATTQNEFIALWKFTVNYLKDTKGVTNFIYAISPQIDQLGSKESFLFRWPGDQYVDFIGFDSYHGTNTSSFSSNLRNLSMLSIEKMKPCGVTETGIEGVLKDGKPYDTYWTKEIGNPLIGKNISMVVMWRNKYDPNGNGIHYYAPFQGHSSSDNFITFYEDQKILFSNDLPNMYELADNVIIE